MKRSATIQKTAATAEARQEILKAAAEVFMEFGFAATSIDAVAERMGATKGRIYHYYRSKADLYFDIQIAAVEKLIGEIEPIAAARHGASPHHHSAARPADAEGRRQRT